MTIADLIARLEKAEGPSAELDSLIAWECCGYRQQYSDEKLSAWVAACKCTDEFKFTRSIDAALTLVPEGYGWRIDWKSQITGKAWASCGKPGEQEQSEGATPAIALCIAALRARDAGKERT